jgi:hypothetical protein
MSTSPHFGHFFTHHLTAKEKKHLKELGFLLWKREIKKPPEVFMVLQRVHFPPAIVAQLEEREQTSLVSAMNTNEIYFFIFLCLNFATTANSAVTIKYN